MSNGSRKPHQGVTPKPTFSIPISNNQRKAESRPWQPAPDANGYSQLNGYAPSRSLRQPKLLSVDEALQYSPFSSIVPFSPGETCQKPHNSSDLSADYRKISYRYHMLAFRAQGLFSRPALIKKEHGSLYTYLTRIFQTLTANLRWLTTP